MPGGRGWRGLGGPAQGGFLVACEETITAVTQSPH